MKKTLLFTALLAALMCSACGSDRKDSHGRDLMTDEKSTIDTSNLVTDSASVGQDTNTMDKQNNSRDSAGANP